MRIPVEKHLAHIRFAFGYSGNARRFRRLTLCNRLLQIPLRFAVDHEVDDKRCRTLRNDLSRGFRGRGRCFRRVRWRGREGQPSYRAARSCDCSARRYGEGPCLLRDPSVWGIARAAGSPRAGVPPPGRPTRCTSRSGWASGSSTNATRSSPSRDGCGRRWSFASAVRRVRRRRPRRRCRAWSRPLVRGHRGDAVVVGRGSGQRKPEGEPAERELDLDRLFVDQRHLRTVRSSHVNALVLLPRRRESCPTSAPRGRCELVRTVRNP